MGRNLFNILYRLGGNLINPGKKCYTLRKGKAGIPCLIALQLRFVDTAFFFQVEEFFFFFQVEDCYTPALSK